MFRVEFRREPTTTFEGLRAVVAQTPYREIPNSTLKTQHPMILRTVQTTRDFRPLKLMAMLRKAKVVLQRGLTDQSELCVHCVGEYLHSKLCLMDSVKQKSATLRRRSK